MESVSILKRKRLDMGLTIKQLALIADCSQSFVCEMENQTRYGHLKSAKFKRLCMSLGIIMTHEAIRQFNEESWKKQIDIHYISGYKDPSPRAARDEVVYY